MYEKMSHSVSANLDIKENANLALTVVSGPTKCLIEQISGQDNVPMVFMFS